MRSVQHVVRTAVITLIAIATTFTIATVSAASLAAQTASQQPDDSLFVRTNYTKHEYRIPMRDGINLFTIVYVPKDASPTNRYPMVMQRTCYSIAPYDENVYPAHTGPNEFMMREKYIFVYQDVRGRYMSEGTWTNVRPILSDAIKARDHKATDEASDTYDTIDWLLKNVANNNDKVGQWGISYPGFFTTAGALSRHPALVASSPQAPVTDFFFEDFHHNGALTQGYFYAYPIFGIASGHPRTDNWWAREMVRQGLPDDYDFQLSLGPLKNTTERFYKDNFFWQEMVQHPNYDEFWRARAIAPHITGVKHAVLVVGGWFDAEDLYGPLKVYKTLVKNDPDAYPMIVEGPFRHGGWSARNVVHTQHNDIYFGDSLETKFQRDVEARFFHHFLKEDGGRNDVGLARAHMFNTGRKEWEDFPSWPAPRASTRDYYFHQDGSLSTVAPTTSGLFLEYVSDPAKPVPSRCLVPTIQGITMRDYMSDDQRCASSREDVLVFRTDTLRVDVTLGGEIAAKLKVSTTGSDADYIVKLIDVYPPSEPDNPYDPNKNIHLGGYQQLVRSEIMRGRFRKSFTIPEPMRPDEITDVSFPLQDVLHTFKKGHQIMVQVQSTWFPVFDRNPQNYVPNIYEANAADFVKATERVWMDATRPSHLEVQVLP
jgi:uncharacterized protein